MFQQLEELEGQLPSLAPDLCTDELGDIMSRMEVLLRRLQNEQKLRKRQGESSLNQAIEESVDHIFPSEVLRQILPFMTASDIGRSMVLTSKSITKRVGAEIIWRDICEKMWPSRNYHVIVAAIGSFEQYFQERQKSISLAQEELDPLPAPRTGPRTIAKVNFLVLDIWKDFPSKLVISETASDLHALLEEGSMTIPISDPVELARLPSNKAHGWNLPHVFDDKSGTRARLQLFQLKGPNDDQSSASTKDINRSPVLLNTGFSVWRGWAKHGEATFLQRQRTVGLRLTDRGQWIQHRIVECRHPRWMNFLGFQFKVVLLCERLSSSKGNSEGISYGITRARIEAIRLHQDSHGNVQHHLFRKDQGWQKHGVTLSHLLEELG